MADLEPTYYYIDVVGEIGLSQGNLIRILYNLWKAVAAICNNIDEDTGNPGTDYMSKIGTDLNSAMAKFLTPHGKTI